MGHWKRQLISYFSSSIGHLPLMDEGGDLYAKCCQSPEYTQRVADNPMFYKGTTRVSTLLEFEKVTANIWSQISAFHHPLLLLQGADDAICETKAARRFGDFVFAFCTYMYQP